MSSPRSVYFPPFVADEREDPTANAPSADPDLNSSHDTGRSESGSSISRGHRDFVSGLAQSLSAAAGYRTSFKLFSELLARHERSWKTASRDGTPFAIKNDFRSKSDAIDAFHNAITKAAKTLTCMREAQIGYYSTDLSEESLHNSISGLDMPELHDEITSMRRREEHGMLRTIEEQCVKWQGRHKAMIQRFGGAFEPVPVFPGVARSSKGGSRKS